MRTSIALVGGTHGNEVTGVRLVERWQAQPHLIARGTFAARAIIGNPSAVSRCVRYVDEDLNRAFAMTALRASGPIALEARRAQELDALLGPKQADPRTDALIDLHTTTAEMGTTLIVYEAAFSLGMAGHLARQLPDVRIIVSDKRREDTIGLQSIAAAGMLVELGPVPHGVLRHDVYRRMDAVVHAALDYIDAVNREPSAAFRGEVEVFRRGPAIPYPTDAAGRIAAMVHGEAQGSDFRELRPGAPLFATFDGEVIRYDGGPGWYPVFINEAAYYGQNMAMRLTRRERLTVVG